MSPAFALCSFPRPWRRRSWGDQRHYQHGHRYDDEQHEYPCIHRFLPSRPRPERALSALTLARDQWNERPASGSQL